MYLRFVEVRTVAIGGSQRGRRCLRVAIELDALRSGGVRTSAHVPYTHTSTHTRTHIHTHTHMRIASPGCSRVCEAGSSSSRGAVELSVCRGVCKVVEMTPGLRHRILIRSFVVGMSTTSYLGWFSRGERDSHRACISFGRPTVCRFLDAIDSCGASAGECRGHGAGWIR